MALCSIGPRQMSAWSSLARNAIDTTCTPNFSAGAIFWPSVPSSAVSPNISGTLGP